MYNDKVDQNELFKEALKYYANILTPFSPMVTRKIDEFFSLSLGLLEEISSLKFTDKKAAAFGSYGWSGEPTKVISD